MWVLGSVIAAAGMQVYIIWGTVSLVFLCKEFRSELALVLQALPYNGGEKNYLEWLFPRPKGLVTSIYAANAVLLGNPSLSIIN